MTHIARGSVSSLLLKPLWGGQEMSSATGFLVTRRQETFLVTNRHVVTGRHQETNETLDSQGATPQELQIVHNSSSRVGAWTPRVERLYDEEIEPLWLEHPEFGRDVDVVALPLTQLDALAIYPYDPWQTQPDIDIAVTSELFVVGFPFGITGGGAFGVWSRASIASEPALNLWNLPRFFVDSRTRPGQSGSPVIFHSPGGAIPIRGRGIHVLGETTRFVGVYSGRVNDQSDLGFVWKQELVQDIVDNGVRPKHSAVHAR